MTQQAPAIESSVPAPAPRAVDRQASRRSWMEPTVRFWWLAFIAVLLITIWVAINNYRAWRYQRALIVDGVRVQATVAEVDGVSRVLRVPPDTPLTLTFEMNGEEHRVQGVLVGRTEYITTRQQVPIRVDPHNPQRWTYATEVPSLRRELAMAQLLLPIVLALGVVVWMRRRRILSLWKTGQPVAVIVASSEQTALAPFSRYVRGALRDSNDKRLVGAYVPQAKADPQRGDVLWFIVDDPGAPRRAIYAGAFS